MMKLEQIVKQEQNRRTESGAFGIKACKDFIQQYEVGMFHRTLEEVLSEYVEKANSDKLFNKRMVLACWELMGNEV